MLKFLWLQWLKYFRPVSYARALGVSVGRDCRLLRCDYSSEPYLIRIGDHVSATRVRFETHDGAVWVMRGANPRLDVVKPVIIEDNVFLGYGCTVLAGVRVGAGSIVGAGSLITRDIPPNTVYAGVPARFIKSVEEYAAKAIEQGDETKHLDDSTKRSYYLRKFGLLEM